MSNYEVLTFKTERLILKAMTEEDAPSYETYFVDYEVVSQLTNNIPWPYPKNGVLNYIKEEIIPKQNKDKWTWGIFLKKTF